MGAPGSSKPNGLHRIWRSVTPAAGSRPGKISYVCGCLTHKRIFFPLPRTWKLTAPGGGRAAGTAAGRVRCALAAARYRDGRCDGRYRLCRRPGTCAALCDKSRWTEDAQLAWPLVLVPSASLISDVADSTPPSPPPPPSGPDRSDA